MLTVKDILKATKGKLIQGIDSKSIKGFAIDSRSIKKNQAFIAIKGARLDGHEFVKQALDNGACALIVSKKMRAASSIPIILVDDTTKALGYIARLHRKQFSIPMIAVTGSVGKTTTKEMIAHALGARFRVLKNTKTENNHFGVPLTLLQLNKSHEAAVIEFGTNQPGDIRWLTKITKPTIAIFTRIGESHLERLKTPRGVFHEKFHLVKFMASKGTVIFNADDKYLSQISRRKLSQSKIGFSIHNPSMYQAKEISIFRHHCQFRLGKQTFALKTLAEHNVYNALAAICCASLFKIRYSKIKNRLSRLNACDSRQEIKRVGSLWLIDDTYNSNPVSFRSAVKTLEAFHHKGRKIFVCGDMFELGDQSKKIHQSCGEFLSKSKVDMLLTFGPNAKFISKRFKELSPGKLTVHCKKIKRIFKQLKKICKSDDVILVKGSRGMNMERVVAFVQGQLAKV